MRYWKTVLAAMTIAALCLAGVAFAHTKFFVTTAGLARFESADGGGGTYSGELVSSKAACKKNRTIVISEAGAGPDTVIARGTTDLAGAYSFFDADTPHGTVEMEAKQRRIPPKNSNHKHVCLAARTHVAVH